MRMACICLRGRTLRMHVSIWAKSLSLDCPVIPPDDVANAQGADYVTLGPFAPTQSKPGYMPTFGPDVVDKATSFGIPVLALGGVDETNVRELKRAGAAGFAMMGSVMRSEDPEHLVRRMLAMWAAET
jgi:thiamine-phosphate pyrophosphorylase